MPFSIGKIPVREGYDFLGLFDAEVGGTQYVSAKGSSLSTYTDKRNLVLFPQWQAKHYTLQLNYGKAPDAGIDRVEVSFDDEIQGLLEDFYMEGSEFIGWYNTQDASGMKFKNGTVMNQALAALADKNNQISLYAILDTAQYTVRFYSYDGNSLIGERQVTHGADIASIAPKTLSDGSEITSWSISKNGYGYEYHGEVTADIDLYVRDFRYVLTLDYGYGNQKDAIHVNHGESCALPDISRERYIFNGWYENGTRVNKQYIPERSTTLTARWTANFYTVSFMTNGGSSINTLEVECGKSIDLPSASREGYIFNYWKTSSGTTVSSPYQPTSDITLYADWTAKTYTVFFNLNGGSMSIGAEQVTYGSSFSLPVPSKDDCAFSGWFYNGNRITDNYGNSVSEWSIASSVTLSAGWELLPTEVYNGTIRDKDFKINRDNETWDTFSLKMDLATLKAKGFTKLRVTVQFAIKENDDCGQHFKLYDEQGNTIYEDVIYHGENKKDTSWGWHSFECEISLSAIQSTTWTLHFWGDNQIFHDYWQGTTTVVVTAMP